MILLQGSPINPKLVTLYTLTGIPHSLVTQNGNLASIFVNFDPPVLYWRAIQIESQEIKTLKTCVLPTL